MIHASDISAAKFILEHFPHLLKDDPVLDITNIGFILSKCLSICYRHSDSGQNFPTIYKIRYYCLHHPREVHEAMQQIQKVHYVSHQFPSRL